LVLPELLQEFERSVDASVRQEIARGLGEAGRADAKIMRTLYKRFTDPDVTYPPNVIRRDGYCRALERVALANPSAFREAVADIERERQG